MTTQTSHAVDAIALSLYITTAPGWMENFVADLPRRANHDPVTPLYRKRNPFAQPEANPYS
jgi:hypothetical protein